MSFRTVRYEHVDFSTICLLKLLKKVIKKISAASVINDDRRIIGKLPALGRIQWRERFARVIMMA